VWRLLNAFNSTTPCLATSSAATAHAGPLGQGGAKRSVDLWKLRSDDDRDELEAAARAEARSGDLAFTRKDRFALLSSPSSFNLRYSICILLFIAGSLPPQLSALRIHAQ